MTTHKKVAASSPSKDALVIEIRKSTGPKKNTNDSQPEPDDRPNEGKPNDKSES